MTAQTTNRELQRTAARVLGDLLSADLPELSWHLYAPGDFTSSYVPPHLSADLLTGQATSHQAVRDWAAHLGTYVELRFGTTPNANAIVHGIVVKVWCAPEFRDDLTTPEG